MDTHDELARARRVASTIAAEAADLALAHAHRGVQVEEKGRANLVSAADREVEELIASRLTGVFRDDDVVGEEATDPTSDGPRSGHRRWYVDPIDGTTNFLKGLPTWGISIGLAGPEDDLLVGVIAMPAARTLFSAAMGQGATRNGVPIRVGEPETLDRTLMCYAHTRRAAEAWGGPERLRAGYVALAGHALGTRIQGCATADLTAVASGTIDGMWAGGLAKWDVSAGLVVALEAGAMVTDVAGDPVTTVCGAFVASPPGVHRWIRDLIDLP